MNTTTKKAILVSSVILATLVGCKTLEETAQTATPTPPEGVTLMAEAELRSTLIGNTYKGESVRNPGSTYVEFIQPDGNISGLWNGNDRYKGKWAISGNVWCYQYKSQSGCNTLAKEGDIIYWYQTDGSTKGGKSVVVAGDPHELGH